MDFFIEYIKVYRFDSCVDFTIIILLLFGLNPVECIVGEDNENKQKVEWAAVF